MIPGTRANWGQPLDENGEGGTVPNLGNRITLHTSSPGGDGWNNRIGKLGNPLPGDRPDSFTFLHSVATNSRGDIYAVCTDSCVFSGCDCGCT